VHSGGGAAFAAVALPQRVTGTRAPPEPGDAVEAHLQVRGVGDVLEGLAEQLLTGVADDGAEFLVEAQQAPIELPVPDADPRVLERAAEPLLALAQRVLGPLALGDVDARAGEAERPAVGVSHHHPAGQEPAVRAVPVPR